MDRRVDGAEAEDGFRRGWESYFGLVLVMGVRRCAWGGREAFRLDMGQVVCVRSLGSEEVGHETVTGSYASERPKYTLGPP